MSASGNRFPPRKHQARHHSGGPDALAPIDIGAGSLAADNTWAGHQTYQAVSGTTLTLQQIAANFVFKNFLLAADAQPAYMLYGNGGMSWGAGGAAALDTTLYRSAAGVLTLAGGMNTTTDLTTRSGGNSSITTGDAFSLAYQSWNIGTSGGNTGAMLLYHYQDSLLNNKMVSLARASGLTHQADASGSGVGDKILLYGTALNGRFGLGIQTNTLVQYVPSGAFVSIRQSPSSGQASSGTDAVKLGADGTITSTQLITAQAATGLTLRMRSTSNTVASYGAIGRTTDEVQFGVPGVTGQFFTGSAVGDMAWSLIDTTKTLRLGTGSAAAQLQIANALVTANVNASIGAATNTNTKLLVGDVAATAGYAGVMNAALTPSVNNYGLLQLSDGTQTILNATTGGGVFLRVNNVTYFTCSATAITSTVPNTITYAGTAQAIRSGAAGSSASWTLGRTAAELTTGVAAAAANFFTDTAAGDIALRVDDSTKTLRMGVGTSASQLRITNTAITSNVFHLLPGGFNANQTSGVGESGVSLDTSGYATFGVTRAATAGNLSYIGLTRSGTVSLGIGVNASNEIILGNTSSGQLISTVHFKTGSGGNTSMVPLAMNSQKITGGAAGTASTDFATVSQLVPAGVISMYGGTAAPTGYVLCDGGSYLRTGGTYDALFAAIGTNYGAVDGTHFTVPNLQDKFARGRATPTTAVATGGVATVTLGLTEIPAHTHSVHVKNGGVNTGFALYAQAADANVDFGDFNTGSAGSSAAHENLPPYQTVNYIIKL